MISRAIGSCIGRFRGSRCLRAFGSPTQLLKADKGNPNGPAQNKGNAKKKWGAPGGGWKGSDWGQWAKIGAVAALGVAWVVKDDVRMYFGLFPQITFTELVEHIQKRSVRKFVVQKVVAEERSSVRSVNRVYVHLDSGEIFLIEAPDLANFSQAIKKIENPTYGDSDLSESDQNVSYIPMTLFEKRETWIYFDQLLNFAFISLFVIYIGKMILNANKGGGMGGIGGMGDQFGLNFKTKKYEAEKGIKVKFRDVAGLDQAKLEIQEFVEFLKTPQKFKRLGAKIPRGALLSGPPGTGKTMLAKACAGEAGVSFYYASGSEFVEMFVGMGASRIRKLFAEAKANGPAIIFIDEIDAMGKKRQSNMGSGDDERDSTLNQLLVELDGFDTDSDVVVFAATNRKELLDTALTRTGRFDRSIEVSLPDLEGRKDIFMVHLQPLVLSDVQTVEKYAKRLATLTPGFSGSDIASICNEAAIQAARTDKDAVSPIDFEIAVERIIGGMEVRKTVSLEEKKTVAVHESGHAVVSWFLEGGDPLLKVRFEIILSSL